MSGELLCKLAGEIGYRPTDRKLTGESLDWMFIGGGSSVAFLDWFCQNISSKNVVNDVDIKEFNILKQQSKILEGTELEEAYQSLDKVTSNEEEEDLEREIMALEAELKPLKEKAKRLARRHEPLDSKLSSTRKRTHQLNTLLTHRKDHFSKIALQKLNHRNDQIERASADLDLKVSQMIDLYSLALSSPQASPFISTSSWTEYHSSEDLYSQQLRMYMRRLLHSDPDKAETSVSTKRNNPQNNPDNYSSESSRYFWTRVVDPQTACFQGVDTQTHVRHSLELTRLNTFYGTSEKARCKAELDLARVSAQLETIKLQMLNDQQYTNIDNMTMKHKMREMHKRLQRVQALVQRNVGIVLPELLGELSKLQSTPILWADYNLKISRLHYQRIKIDKVVKHLLLQRSRSALLGLGLESEKKSHLWTFALLNSLKNDKISIGNAFDLRIEDLKKRIENPSLASSQTAKSLMTIFQILSGTSIANNPSKVLEVTQTVGDRMQDVESGRMQQSEAEIQVMEKMKQNLAKLVDLLFQGSTGRHPLLTPTSVVDACRKVDNATSTLAAAMETVMQKYTSKKKEITDLPKERLFERNLWLYFFGRKDNAEIIKRAFIELSAKTVARKLRK